MRDVDHHAEAVHLAHHLLAELGEAVVLGLVGGGVRPVVVAEMGQRHGANAQAIIHAQHAQVVVNLVSAFQSEDCGDLASADDALDIGGAGGKLDLIGMRVQE